MGYSYPIQSKEFPRIPYAGNPLTYAPVP
jgi:hypothetical protein